MIHTRNVAPVAVLCALLALQPSCNSPYQNVCTLIGCSDGVSFDIRGAAPDGAQVTVTATGQAQRTFSCAASSTSCLMFLDNFAPVTVTVDVLVRGMHKITTVQPVYTVTTPNGINCPPTCKQANVVVQV
jgi:hypothetical protein